MLQWIAGLEKVAATSHFVAKHRFGSFAPIRHHVSAQWLVDGVSPLSRWWQESVSPSFSIPGSETTSGTYHVRFYSRKTRSISTTGGYPLVSAHQKLVASFRGWADVEQSSACAGPGCPSIASTGCWRGRPKRGFRFLSFSSTSGTLTILLHDH
jgi:hypothetical protein